MYFGLSLPFLRSLLRSLFPPRHASMPRARAAVVPAEAIRAIAALRACAFRHGARARMRGRVDDVAVAVHIMAVVIEVGFVGLLLLVAVVISVRRRARHDAGRKRDCAAHEECTDS